MARLICTRLFHIYGVESHVVFPPVSKQTTIPLMCSFPALSGWKRTLIDVTNAFEIAPLKKQIYVGHLEGFLESGKENQVFLFWEVLYGLCKSLRERYVHLHKFLWTLGAIKMKLMGSFISRRIAEV